MATYYVRPGANGNGTGQALNQAWGTIAQALAASGGMSSGDTVYIAPGNYNEQLTVNFTSPTVDTFIIGDPTASQFTGMSAGYVRITAYPANQASAANISGVLFSATSKNYLNIKNIHFESNSSTSGVDILTSQNTKIDNCSFINHDGSGRALTLSKTSGTSTPIDATVKRCVFLTMKGASNRNVFITGTASINISLNVTFNDCLFFSSGVGVYVDGNNIDFHGGVSYYNCTFVCGVTSIYNANGGASGTYPHIVKNCILHSPTGINNAAGSVGYYSITYSRILSAANIGISTSGTGTSTTGALGLETGYSLINAIQTSPLFTSVSSSPNQNFGNATSAPTTDIYNVAWSGASPDAGSGTYNNVIGITAYNPTDRNASTITIAPGETSRSLYLYLGATGITHTTTNLTASYTRNGQASVPITLVAQTPTGSYVSGGFCEVSAPYARGTYRLDVPNAAFDFGADDVTIFVGGANTTNGAVVTCNMQGIAGNIVHIGPFKVIADGLGSDQPLDIVQGVQAPVSVQLVDANENGVDISGATVEAKVYNAIGSLIATYVCVPVYAADGRCTFQLTTLVTNTAGVYKVTLTRTIGGNIIVFGPMKMIVRAN